MQKYLITGGNGRFATELKKILKDKKNFIFFDKKNFDITDRKQISSVLNKYKPNSVIHLAGLSRPMISHEKNIQKSIALNILGTGNIVLECEKRNIKVIYFSTNYVYPGKKGNYDENAPLLPMNNYAWSKLGGEAAVQMYKNSLILRVAMTESPWVHPFAFSNLKINFLYHDEVTKLLPKILKKKGIINLGGNENSIFKFAKETNNKVRKILYSKKTSNVVMPQNSTINISKLKKMLKTK